MIFFLGKILIGGALLAILISVFSAPVADNGEPAKRNFFSIFLKGFVLFLFLLMVIIAWPNMGHPSRNPRSGCNATSRVLAGTIEEFYKKNGTAADPINLSDGRIDFKFLRDRNYLKFPIESFPQCIYLGFPNASGSVEVFCLSCGFPDQTEPSIHDEFVKRFALASPSASIMRIDFTTTEDCSQMDREDYLKRNEYWHARFHIFKELFGLSEYRTIEQH